VPFSVHEHRPTYTAQEMAAEEHISGKKIAKPVVVQTPGGYAMCVLPASSKLDFEKASRVLDARSLSLADERDLAKLFQDAETGAEPPIGKLYDMPTIVDRRLASAERICFQAGTHRHAIEMDYDDYASVTQARVEDIALGQ
jgi:Ala-tRNA(Pro) deacylase